METLVVDNFQGRLTRYKDGKINSGFAKYTSTFGSDPLSSPGNLTWFEAPQRASGPGPADAYQRTHAQGAAQNGGWEEAGSVKRVAGIRRA